MIDQSRFAFDLDSTITSVEIFPALARAHFGEELAEQILAQTRASVAGKLPYEDTLRERVEQIARIPRSKIHEVVAQLPLHERLVAWIREHATQCLIVTHNFASWIEPIAQRLGCEVHASSPRMVEGEIRGLEKILDKAKVIDREVAKGHHVVAVGDGINDRAMFRAAHWAIAWSAVHPVAPELLEVAQEELRDEELLCERLDAMVGRSPQAFLGTALEGVYEAIATRRDIRSFIPGKRIDANTRHRLMRAFYQAPNVGLMQPASLIRIVDAKLRRELYDIVQVERQRTAEAYAEQQGDSRSDDFLSLKVEGVLDCAELWVVALRDGRDGEIFGRRTMPAMDLASASCAIQNIWLAARAEGLGMGWVSIFEPVALAQALSLPEGAQAIAILCLGPTEHFPDRPKLAIDGWRQPRAMQTMIFEDQWGQTPSDAEPGSKLAQEKSSGPSDSAVEPVSKTGFCELILGGARSGKSEYAESKAVDSGRELIYLATAQARDAEMQDRIALHQARRGSHWKTVQSTTALAAALKEHDGPSRVILVDCLTLWLSNCLHAECWVEEKAALLDCLAQLESMVLLVSNEVGLGVVPMGQISRIFVDESGRLHQDLAKLCSRVTQITAGIPQFLKS